jgi:DNA-binding HxlR family transcriptional regulator
MPSSHAQDGTFFCASYFWGTHDFEFREMLDRVGDKWSLLVIAMLDQRPTQRARFSELHIEFK